MRTAHESFGAAELEKAGYASRILVSGPTNLLGHESDDTIVYAARKGYPASYVRSRCRFHNGLIPPGPKRNLSAGN